MYIFFINLCKSTNHFFNKSLLSFALLALFFTIPAMASDWYKNYGLKKNIIFSEKFNSSVTFYQTAKHSSKASITLIHGVGGSAEDFKTLVAGLSKNYDLLLLDLPGFGLSNKHENIFAPQKYATLLIDLLPSLTNRTNYILGHSMGGNVSVQIALQAPELATKLILIDAAGFLNKFSYSEHLAANYIGSQLPVARQYSSTIKNFVGKLNQFLPDPTGILLSPAGRALILENDINSIAAIAVMNEQLSKLIRKAPPPTFIIWGGKDRVMPVQVSTMLSYLLNTHDVYIFPDAGHSPQKQYPLEVITKIDHFINSKQELSPPKMTLLNENVTIDCTINDSLSRLNNAGFLSVTIKNCQQGLVSHLRTTKLTMYNSKVNFGHLNVNNNEGYAIVLHSSRMEIWGGRLNAVSIAYLNNSQLELNGVELYASNDLVISNLPTTISASLTRVHLNGVVHDWHGVIDIGL
jgi:pimeloyl-ACP methyl ester carboxylesterase